MEKGQIKAHREALLAVLEDRFSPLPEEILRRTMACDDPQLLQTAIRHSWRIQDLAELSL